MGRTLMDVFDAVAGQYPQRPAMRIKRDGRWRVTTWSVYRELARRVARAFIALHWTARRSMRGTSAWSGPRSVSSRKLVVSASRG